MISGKNIRGALHYNEQKVVQGAAQCIMASGFLKEGHDMTFYEKLRRFTDLNQHNTRSKTNTLHISLNFDVSETPDVTVLRNIASAYMNKIGFGEQPYLVYNHTDAAHPHLHILSTLIQSDGKRIPIHHLGQNQSEQARKEIEQEFHLVVADNKNKQQHQQIKSAVLNKAVYGKSETKRAIANIVWQVTREYKYASLPELNAVLRQYNVEATRGSEKSIMFQKRGLIYTILDANGKRIGIPIKASALPGKPTLAFLEKQFVRHEAARLPFREQLKKKIHQAIRTIPERTLTTLINELHRKGVKVIPRHNDQGRLYGITFIDQLSKVVFNGSSLGKDYSAAAITNQLLSKDSGSDLHQTLVSGQYTKEHLVDSNTFSEKSDHLLKQLILAEGADTLNPNAGDSSNQKRKRKKRKRRGQ